MNCLNFSHGKNGGASVAAKTGRALRLGYARV